MSDTKDDKAEKLKSKSPGWTADEIAVLAEAQAKRALKAAEQAKKTVEEKAQKEYEEAAKEASAVTADSKFTDKRAGEVIFRREMQEPEFWLTKEGLIPPRPILTKEQEDEITKNVEIPEDQTPQYKPQHILSPEFGGISNYEIGMEVVRDELLSKLSKLKTDPDVTQKQITDIQKEITKIDTLYENFHIGMNVFRTAKGGRDKIKK